MGRTSRVQERRRKLLPVVAQAFADLGYARTTTAALARRCGVRENILYRLWPSKRAMFLASIGHVYDFHERVWNDLAAAASPSAAAERLLAYEAEHLGELGLQRILFAGLGESEESDVRDRIRDTYRRFQEAIRRRIVDHRRGRPSRTDPGLSAWAVMGLGTIATLGLQLGLLSARDRRRLLTEIGRLLLDGRPWTTAPPGP